jgi:hypothetical protein
MTDHHALTWAGSVVGGSHRGERGGGDVGTSLLIMLVGMLVPVLAAAPFYIQDRRADLRAAHEPAGQAGSASEGNSSEEPALPESGEDPPAPTIIQRGDVMGREADSRVLEREICQ